MGPLSASKLERMCSRRNAPMGTIPESECNLRQINDEPSPARSGCTPWRTWWPGECTVGGAAGGWAVAMKMCAPFEQADVPYYETKFLSVLRVHYSEHVLGSSRRR